MHWGMFNSIPGLYVPGAPLHLWEPKMPLDIIRSPLRIKPPLVKHHWVLETACSRRIIPVTLAPASCQLCSPSYLGFQSLWLRVSSMCANQTSPHTKVGRAADKRPLPSPYYASRDGTCPGLDSDNIGFFPLKHWILGLAQSPNNCILWRVS